MKTSAIIIAAYRASPWIGECLDSWEKVRVPDGWMLDIRIGVDGCEDTARTLESLGVPYWYSEENVGPYLIRNALIMQERADAYTIFDADDRALPEHQELLLPLAGEGDVSAGAHYPMGVDGQRTTKRARKHSNGVCVISHGAWEKLGGFRPWRIRADSEMHGRLSPLGIAKHTTAEAVFERRDHPESLTRAEGTRHRSKSREAAIQEAAKLRRKKDHVVTDPACAVMEWRDAKRARAREVA